MLHVPRLYIYVERERERPQGASSHTRYTLSPSLHTQRIHTQRETYNVHTHTHTHTHTQTHTDETSGSIQSHQSIKRRTGPKQTKETYYKDKRNLLSIQNTHSLETDETSGSIQSHQSIKRRTGPRANVARWNLFPIPTSAL